MTTTTCTVPLINALRQVGGGGLDIHHPKCRTAYPDETSETGRYPPDLYLECKQENEICFPLDAVDSALEIPVELSAFTVGRLGENVKGLSCLFTVRVLVRM